MLINNRTGLLLITPVIFILTGSCDRSEDPVQAPVILKSVSPVAGNTTQTFLFDLSGSESRSSTGTRLFSRWDWDGDGRWDTPLTRLLKYEHRYYAPGTWRPRIEMVNLDGGWDTASFTIPVERGYSAPRPKLTVEPSKGHIYTQFLLDASQTLDDEDSLDQLSFRWDYESDGTWDTQPDHIAQTIHRFSEAGFYQVGLEVRDPAGLITRIKAPVTVTLEDPRLIASFRWSPDSVTNDTAITLDASASIDPDFPDKPLQYRWNWNNDAFWDTEWLTDPVIIHYFDEVVFSFVKLEVKSHRGLLNDTLQKIRVYHRNVPPRAAFGVSTQTGNLRTQFRFDGWFCRDFESATSKMFYRWDFEGDGRYDTEPTHDVVILHTYDHPGVYQPTLELTDLSGGTDTCSTTVWVSNGTNQTDMIRYAGQFTYENIGTVLIGDQWWFSRNLSTQDTTKFYLQTSINGWEKYYRYGNLYTVPEPTTCPEGWRIPSKEDWARLFSNYDVEELFDALLPGGLSDFGLMMGGRATGFSIPSATLAGLGREATFWTTSHPLSAEPSNKWIVTFYLAGKSISQGYNPSEGKWYSVRCVKDR